MFDKFNRYYKGRVYIQVKGDGLTKFINEARKDGIVFYNGKQLPDRFVAEINVEDFARLRRAAKEAGIKINIRAKYGFPFVAYRWQKRVGLIAGLFIIFFALTALSQFVLSVSVEGNERVSQGQIIAEAERLGVKRWMIKRNLELDNISKQLQENNPDLVWVTMEERGTNIRIRVVEKTLPKKVVFQGDLISAKTGFVEEVIVIQGQPVVKEGQMVKKDQILIKADGSMTQYSFDVSGKNNARESKVDAPAAKGFVRGRVWYSSTAEVVLSEDLTEETGNVANGWGIKISERVIMITNQNSPYAQSLKESHSYTVPAWRNWRFPVEIIKTNYQETRHLHVERTVSEARELAEKRAREDLKQKIPADAKVLQDKVRILTTDKGVEKVRVELETYEELAVYRQ